MKQSSAEFSVKEANAALGQLFTSMQRDGIVRVGDLSTLIPYTIGKTAKQLFNLAGKMQHKQESWNKRMFIQNFMATFYGYKNDGDRIRNNYALNSAIKCFVRRRGLENFANKVEECGIDSSVLKPCQTKLVDVPMHVPRANDSKVHLTKS